MDLEKSVIFIQRENLQRVIDALVADYVKKDVRWTEDDISDLSVQLPQKTVEELYKVDNKFKYCAVCTITKKSQSSLHINSACMWNAARDGFISSQSENAIFFCILNVFAIGI